MNLSLRYVFAYPLIFTVVVSVISRYFFNSQVAWGYDMSWMLYSVISFLGCGYVLEQGGHIKVDVVYSLFGPKIKHLISTITYLVFFFSSVIGILISSYNLMVQAIISGERGAFTSWAPPLAPIRIMLFVSVILLLLQGLVIFRKHVMGIYKGGEKE